MIDIYILNSAKKLFTNELMNQWTNDAILLHLTILLHSNYIKKLLLITFVENYKRSICRLENE